MVREEKKMTKYHQQAQATNQRRKVWRAEIKQEKSGSFTLTPEKIHKESSELGTTDAKSR